MITFAIIADDLTGACDSAVRLGRGRNTKVLVDHSFFPGSVSADVLAVNCNTRDLSPEESAERVFAVAKKLTDAGCSRIYKKMDSLMRGNCGAETEAVMRACRTDLAFVVPAIPWLSRKVTGGRLNVNGEDTGINAGFEFRKTCSLPVENIYADQLRGDESQLNQLLQDYWEQGIRVLVFDAETEEDLDRIYRLSRQTSLRITLAGASGMAAHVGCTAGDVGWEQNGAKLPERHPCCSAARHFEAIRRDTERKNPVLLISGSYNEATHHQMSFLENSCGSFLLTADGKAAAEYPEREKQSALKKLEREMIRSAESGSNLKKSPALIGFSIVCKAGNPVLKNKNKIEAFTGELAEAFMEKTEPIALILTGGDTACSVMRKLGISELELIEEVVPGIPVGIVSGGAWEGLIVITKSGSFGDRDVFVRILNYLTESTEENIDANEACQ